MLALASQVTGSASTLPTTISGQILTGFGDVDGAPAIASLGLRLGGVTSLSGLQRASALTAQIYQVLPSGELAAPAPQLLSTQTLNVVNGAVTVLLRAAAKDAVFQVVLAP